MIAAPSPSTVSRSYEIKNKENNLYGWDSIKGKGWGTCGGKRECLEYIKKELSPPHYSPSSISPIRLGHPFAAKGSFIPDVCTIIKRYSW